MKRLRSLNLLWGILGVLFLATLIYPTIASSDGQDGIGAAWQRAREAGSYRFAADVVQTTVPLPTVTNVGRQSKRDALRIEGQTNLPDQTMRLTLWSQGGSVLNAEGGIEVAAQLVAGDGVGSGDLGRGNGHGGGRSGVRLLWRGRGLGRRRRRFRTVLRSVHAHGIGFLPPAVRGEESKELHSVPGRSVADSPTGA